MPRNGLSETLRDYGYYAKPNPTIVRKLAKLLQDKGLHGSIKVSVVGTTIEVKPIRGAHSFQIDEMLDGGRKRYFFVTSASSYNHFFHRYNITCRRFSTLGRDKYILCMRPQ